MRSYQYLSECFNLNSETGEIRWKERPLSHFYGFEDVALWFNQRHAGQPIKIWSGGQTPYFCNKILVHRLVFQLHHKLDYEQIPAFVKFKNGDKTDVRPENLIGSASPASRVGMEPSTCRPRKEKLPRGVTKLRSGKFQAGLVVKGRRKPIILGEYDTPIEAFKRYCEAAVCILGVDEFNPGPKPSESVSEWKKIVDMYKGTKP